MRRAASDTRGEMESGRSEAENVPKNDQRESEWCYKMQYWREIMNTRGGNKRNLEKLNKERGRNRENKKLNAEIPKPEKDIFDRE